MVYNQCNNEITILMNARKLKEVREEGKDTHRYIMVRNSSSFFLLHSSMALMNLWEIIMILYYFDKFATSILITMKYHTIISFVDAVSQTSRKNKIPKYLDLKTLISIIIMLQVFVCSNPP